MSDVSDPASTTASDPGSAVVEIRPAAAPSPRPAAAEPAVTAEDIGTARRATQRA